MWHGGEPLASCQPDATGGAADDPPFITERFKRVGQAERLCCQSPAESGSGT
jgi:hypothetical protein